MIPSVFAETYTVEHAAGSSSPGCEETNECFIPYQLSIDAGDTVRFLNSDGASHTVTSGTLADGANGLFDSSLYGAGSVFSHTFTENGTYDYFCMVHPRMVGSVVVGDGISEEYFVTTDKSAYNLGDTVTISGFYRDDRTRIDILVTDSDGTLKYVQQLTPNSDFTFSDTFMIGGNLSESGYYIVHLSTSQPLVTTTFEILKPQPMSSEVKEFGELQKADAFTYFGMYKQASIHYGKFLKSCSGMVDTRVLYGYQSYSCAEIQEIKDEIDQMLQAYKSNFEHVEKFNQEYSQEWGKPTTTLPGGGSALSRNHFAEFMYYMNIGEYSTAMELYNEWSKCNALCYHPDRTGLAELQHSAVEEWSTISLLNELIGDYEMALQTKNTAITLNNKLFEIYLRYSPPGSHVNHWNVWLWYDKIILLYKSGEYQEALNYFDRGYVHGHLFLNDQVHSSAVHWNHELRAGSMIVQGVIAERMGDMETANSFYDKVQKHDFYYDYSGYGGGQPVYLVNEQVLYEKILIFVLEGTEDLTLADKYIQKLTDPEKKKAFLEIVEYFEIVEPFLPKQIEPEQVAEPVDEPKSEPTQTSGGCGAGTVLVDGVCELAPTQSKSSFMSIEPLYIIIGVVAIGGIIGAIAVAKRGSKTPKPAKQELDEYEEQYLTKQKPAKQKPVEKKETSAFCENCGKKLNPTAKFCGGCGTKV